MFMMICLLFTYGLQNCFRDPNIAGSKRFGNKAKQYKPNVTLLLFRKYFTLSFITVTPGEEGRGGISHEGHKRITKRDNIKFLGKKINKKIAGMSYL